MQTHLEVKHRELREMLTRCYETQTSLFIHGTTGIGKSYAVWERAKNQAEKQRRIFVDWNRASDEDKKKFIVGDKENKVSAAEYRRQHFLFVDIRISQMDPSDLRGLPVIVGNEHGFVEWQPSMVFWILSRPESAGVLFLDEMNLAAPVVQAAAYQIIRDRCVGELSFPSGVAVVGAGNTSKDRANVFEMSAPLKNRFAHVRLAIPGVDSWADEYAFDAGVDSRIIGYLKFKPSSLMAEEKIIQDMQSLAFPTPRTWDMCSNMIKGIANPQTAARFAHACIGPVAGEFKVFLEMNTTLNLDEIIKDPTLLKTVDLQGKWVLISAAADRYRSNKRELSTVINLCKALHHENRDFAISGLRLAKAAHPEGFATACGSNPEAIKLLTQYSQYLMPNMS